MSDQIPLLPGPQPAPVKEKYAAQKAWKRKNAEAVRIYNREWKRKNRDKLNALQNARREKNLEQARAYDRQWYHKNSAKKRERAKMIRQENPNPYRANRLKRYGITVAEYDAMHASQRGPCAICRHENIENRRLCVDHDHVTWKIRGLLCGPCNKALGLFKESADVLRLALQYLDEHAKDQTDALPKFILRETG